MVKPTKEIAPLAESLDLDLALMEEAAREAGAIALDYVRRGFGTWTKTDRTPVTDADIAVDRFLQERLTARRDYGWLSEESENDPARLEAEKVFIIDPIDGTAAFAKGRPDWVVSLGLIHGHSPVAGVIYSPVEERMFTARLGGGAYLNGEPIRVRENPDMAAITLASETRELELALKDEGFARPQVTRCLAFAYRLCLVAEGSVDASVTFRPKKDWDVVAGDIILTEAGGTVTDAAGEPLRYNRVDVNHASVIAAGPLHAPLQSLLEKRL